MNAISLVMETGFAVTAFLALFLNLVIPEEIEDDIIDLDAVEQENRTGAATGIAGPGKEHEGKGGTVGESASSRGSDIESSGIGKEGRA